MEKLKVESKTVKIRSILESDINPQKMKESDFKRLIDSIKKDGVLTSSVLLQEIGPDKYVCISGHHRIRASLKAGLKLAECLIVKDISESTRIRLQLQHNDIHGEPDEYLVTELKKLLLEEDLKLVSQGLNKMLKNNTFNYEPVLYSHIIFALLPEIEKEFNQLMTRLDTEEAEKYILEKPDYLLVKECLTKAFKKGYKTPGKALREILNIYLQNESNSGKA